MCTQVITFTELGYTCPGSSYRDQGENSAEEYFDEFFESKIRDSLYREYQIIFDDEKLYGLPLTYFRTIIELSIETFGLSAIVSHFNITDSKIPNYNKDIYKETINFYSHRSCGYKHFHNLKHCKRYN